MPIVYSRNYEHVLKRYRFTVKKKTSATARQTKKYAVNSPK